MPKNLNGKAKLNKTVTDPPQLNDSFDEMNKTSRNGKSKSLKTSLKVTKKK